MSNHFRSILDEAWRHRRAQDLPACMDLLSELKAELALPYTRLQPDVMATVLKPLVMERPADLVALTLETLILWGSLLRAQREMLCAQELLKCVESLIGFVPAPERRPLIARLSQEQGLNAYATGDFSVALEHFAVQGRLGASAVERSMGQVNGLLCYESLGLPTSAIHKRVRQSIAEAQESGLALTNELENVVIDFERRHAFSRGDLDAVFDTDIRDTRYSAYMRAWMGSLPWHMRYHDDKALGPLIAAMSPEAGALHMQDFRLRTMQGISLPQDALQMPTGELAIRAYVWTWRWLMNPEAFDVQRILDTLASPVLVDHAKSIAPGHAHMLRNAALWIGLFCASHAARFERWSKALPFVGGDGFLVFNWENLLIRFIEAKHHHRANATSDMRAVAASIPSGTENGILFGDLIAAQDHPEAAASLLMRAPWLTQLLKHLGMNANDTGAPNGSGGTKTRTAKTAVATDSESVTSGVTINLLTHELRRDGIAQMSRGMAIGFAVLKSRGKVSRADFVAMVWGIHNYEPGIHDVKILNLLARMRAVTGAELRLGVKDHVVFGSGDWSQIQIVGSLSRDGFKPGQNIFTPRRPA
jgi:hypothetical protein